MITFRVMMNGGYRVPPSYRNYGSTPPSRPPLYALKPGLSLLALGVTAAFAYRFFKTEEEKSLSEQVVEVALCKISEPPSLNDSRERHLIAYTLARTSDRSCHHLIYNMIRMGEFQDAKVIDFLTELVRQARKPDANDAIKESLSRWLILLKSRQGTGHRDLIIRLTKEGHLPDLFSNTDFQRLPEGSRNMNELKSDWLDLKHKKLV